jgi:type IV pilus assembly protein PilA
MVELMVVVLIIGILIAIGLPIFLGARTRAENAAAGADLRNAMAAAKIYFSTGETYTGFNVAGAQAQEPDLPWAGAGDPGATKDIAIVAASGPDVLLVRRSVAGTYYCASDDGTTSRIHADDAQPSTYADVDTVAECSGLPGI